MGRTSACSQPCRRARRLLYQRRFPLHNISSYPPLCTSLPSPSHTRPQNHALIISHV